MFCASENVLWNFRAAFYRPALWADKTIIADSRRIRKRLSFRLFFRTVFQWPPSSVQLSGRDQASRRGGMRRRIAEVSAGWVGRMADRLNACGPG